ncbi:PBECR4 domain-containing protein [Fructobacillus fructosus]|uniref:Phage-Barnase-EndoU-ColicinE5/D-RelE like nuclease 4 domain-containing protein n=1 Tax=Fructobacillus fructosus TaxID=1631 RepID=A0ABN9YWI7_9LACO|nr:hypothetical protein R54839_PPFHFPJH_01288 [Fructobacillus fructosus]
MTDKLLTAAQAYHELSQFEFKVILGKKRKKIEKTLYFNHSNFFHLAGLHKLTDLNLLDTTDENGRQLTPIKVFEKILTGELSNDYFKKSIYYHLILDRIKIIISLQHYISNHRMMFNRIRYTPGSKIRWHWLMVFQEDSKCFLFFAEEKNNTNVLLPISAFFSGNIDYTKGQSHYTVLKLNKFSKQNNIEQILYQNPNYKEN